MLGLAVCAIAVSGAVSYLSRVVRRVSLVVVACCRSGLRSGQGDPREACVGADRGADCLVCACGATASRTLERIKDRIADQILDILVPLVMEEIVAAMQEVMRLVPQERVQQRTVDPIVDFPVPQIL